MNKRDWYMGLSAMYLCFAAAGLNLAIAVTDITPLHSLNLVVAWFSGWSGVFQLEFYRWEKGNNAEDGNES